ncbi:biotin transporter BioY [Xanthobacter tagetidis]|jgi:biotin transport system substrate-specific component|uniref:Biotin transporter n=1 Tax=Xanthobacter tagetidis TaxID=60216 RepID=A0A3L7ACX7_9HYPH|nr:biotin transporter BioY [Xanthobacter tagetidis]MBB6309758.1 biotin transport system substrate-specific component [Xanthobacter tagetidis]RLP78213.1 biotin transporter BioY [Xanthobacter tagetidis]
MTATASPPPAAAPFRPVFARLAEHTPAWSAAVVVVSVALIAWAAQLSIPVEPVPITLQSYAVLAIGALLGSRLALLALVAYVGLGLSGLHLFAGGRTGLDVLLGPSGGFLIGFIVAAVLVGRLQESWAKMNVVRLFGAILLGHAVIMALGAGWLAWQKGLAFAIDKGTLPFLPGAVIKSIAVLATVIVVERLAGTPRPR